MSRRTISKSQAKGRRHPVQCFSDGDHTVSLTNDLKYELAFEVATAGEFSEYNVVTIGAAAWERLVAQGEKLRSRAAELYRQQERERAELAAVYGVNNGNGAKK